MEQAICLAEDLGIRIIQLAGYDVYYEKSTRQTAAWFEANLRRAAELASEAGVMLGFETMETEYGGEGHALCAQGTVPVS